MKIRSVRRATATMWLRRPAPGRSGFTLVETVLALSLSGMLTSIAAQVTVETVRIQRASKRALDARWERHRLFEQFDEDLGLLVTWMPDEALSGAFPEEADVLLRAVCLVPFPSAAPTGLRRMPAEVTYARQRDSGDAGWRLVRTVDYLIEDGPSPAQVVLGAGLSDLRVDVRTSDGWVLPDKETDLRKIDAIRIGATWLGETARYRVVRMTDVDRRLP